MERVTNLDSVGEVNNNDQIEMIDEVDLDEDEMIDIGMSVQMQILNNAIKEMERRQHIGSVVLLCYVVHALHLHQLLSTYLQSQVTEVSPQREKRKAPMIDLVEAQLERMISGIGLVADALNKGNSISGQLHDVAKKLHDIAKQQITIAERQVAAIEKRNEILQHSRPRVYTGADVWDMLSELNLNLLEKYHLQCYEFLCNDDKKKQLIFGVPPHMRLQLLFQMLNDPGHR